MRKLFLLAIGILFSVSAQAQRSTNNTSSADKLGWQLAVHSYTFQRFPILDAIDMTHALGVKNMSVSEPLQLISAPNSINQALIDCSSRKQRDHPGLIGVRWYRLDHAFSAWRERNRDDESQTLFA